MRAPHRLGAVLLAVGLTALPQTAATGPAVRGGLTPASAAATVPRCEGRPATIVGTNSDDRLVGTPADDVIVGRKGADRIDGGGGDDAICGNAGTDVLLGGRGNDYLHGGADQRAVGPGGSYLVGDRLVGGPGRDHLEGGVDRRKADQRRRPDTYSWADATRRVTVDLSGAGGVGTARGRGHDSVVVGASSAIIGSAYGDRITGSRGRDRVLGGDGDDRIDTRRGIDQVFPDSGPKAPGRDVVVTGRGNDLVSSLAGRDVIATGGGADFVEAFSSAPTVVRLGAGDDYDGHSITPGSGAAADGGPGDDVITFYGTPLAEDHPGARFVVDRRRGTTHSVDDVATGTIAGFEGHRLVGPLKWGFVGSRGSDRVWAIEGGPLVARGLAGNDRFTGSPRDDKLFGGAGDDHVADSGGSDRCRGIEHGAC